MNNIVGVLTIMIWKLQNLICEIGLNWLKHTFPQPTCPVLQRNSDCSSEYTLSETELTTTIRKTIKKVIQNLPMSVECWYTFWSHLSTKCQDMASWKCVQALLSKECNSEIIWWLMCYFCCFLWLLLCDLWKPLCWLLVWNFGDLLCVYFPVQVFFV